MYCSLKIIDALSDTPQGTTAIAKKLGCHHRTALIRLHKLHDEGKINGCKIRPCKAGEWVWWKKKLNITGWCD